MTILIVFITLVTTNLTFASEKEFLKKAQKMEGIFTVYKYKNKYYMEIPITKLNKLYFVSLQVSKGIGVAPFYGGITLPVFDGSYEYTQAIYFKSSLYPEIKDGDTIEVDLYCKNLRYRSSFDQASTKLVEKSFSDNLITSTKGIYLDKKIYIDLEKLTQEVRFFFHSPIYQQLATSFNQVTEVKAYPKNVIIYLSYLVSYSEKGRSYYISQNFLNLTKNNEVILALNIFEHDNPNYKPREYDDRVGYFAFSFSDVSIDDGTKGDGIRAIKTYITRWDISNGKKIKIWLENTWPEQYRQVAKEGILEWNKAFNKIGYTDPIEVDIQPYESNWEPEDIRYSVVRYQDGSAAFAIGPSLAVPTTGEIVDADVVFYAPMIRAIKSRFDYYYDVIIANSIRSQFLPTTFLTRILFHTDKSKINLYDAYYLMVTAQKHIEENKRMFGYLLNNCDYQVEKANQTLIALTAIMISNPQAFDLNKDKFAKDYVKDIVIHEIGHILGLRHNFKASSFVSQEQLSDESYTSKNGICYSCMDYIPANIHYRNGRPYFTRDVFMTTIGYYDCLAIEYGYTQEESKLKEIASKAGVYYGTDEDLICMDPNIRQFDLSDKPHVWLDNLTKTYRYVLQNAPYRLSKAGSNPKMIYQATSRTLQAYAEVKLENLIYTLLGKHINRVYLGDSTKKNVEIIDSKVKEFAINQAIKDLLSEKPLIDKNTIESSIMFGHYDWGYTEPQTVTLFDRAYIIERLHRLMSLLILLMPLSTKYEYYYDQKITISNINKLYESLLETIKPNQTISQIKQQAIEDFIYILVYISGYSEMNSEEDVIVMNTLFLPSVRNKAFETLQKIENKLKSIKNNLTATAENKVFCSRMLHFINTAFEK